MEVFDIFVTRGTRLALGPFNCGPHFDTFVDGIGTRVFEIIHLKRLHFGLAETPTRIDRLQTANVLGRRGVCDHFDFTVNN